MQPSIYQLDVQLTCCMVWSGIANLFLEIKDVEKTEFDLEKALAHNAARDFFIFSYADRSSTPNIYTAPLTFITV